MYIWNHTLQSHRMGVVPIHERHQTQKSITVMRTVSFTSIQQIVSDKKTQSHSQKIAPCERALKEQLRRTGFNI